ncbi:hypothetical protein ACE14D_12855, partial [Streptomyces sp. Act-28]
APATRPPRSGPAARRRSTSSRTRAPDPLGVLGRSGGPARLAGDGRRDPGSPANKMSTGATVRLLGAVVVVAGAGPWFMR